MFSTYSSMASQLICSEQYKSNWQTFISHPTHSITEHNHLFLIPPMSLAHRLPASHLPTSQYTRSAASTQHPHQIQKGFDISLGGCLSFVGGHISSTSLVHPVQHIFSLLTGHPHRPQNQGMQPPTHRVCSTRTWDLAGCFSLLLDSNISCTSETL